MSVGKAPKLIQSRVTFSITGPGAGDIVCTSDGAGYMIQQGKDKIWISDVTLAAFKRSVDRMGVVYA